MTYQTFTGKTLFLNVINIYTCYMHYVVSVRDVLSKNIYVDIYDLSSMGFVCVRIVRCFTHSGKVCILVTQVNNPGLAYIHRLHIFNQ